MFRRPVTVVLSCWIAAAAGQVAAQGLLLADAGRTDYRIVVADDASSSTKHGVEELQKFLEQISGARLPILSDREPLSDREIILGDNAHLRQLNLAGEIASLGPEGYIIRTNRSRLIIAGGAVRGNLYGVYGFLEDHLGCRWFTPEVSRIPKQPRLIVAPINDRQVPALEYRNPLLADCLDGDWCARNRMNAASARLDARHGGKIRFADGFFVHTFNRLVPPEKYFDAHPQYFSMILGRRKKNHSQLCCTNPEVIRICTDEVLQAMRRQPDATVFSVSQNDWYDCCQCRECRALSKREGSEMAPVLRLVNCVAEAAEKQFPDKRVETLAYQWTRRPPKTIRPRRNVIVRLCSIECCFSHPLATCDSKQNREFREDLEGWSKIATRLWVWNYTTDFLQYLLPYPNMRARVENVRFFAAHKVTGVMEQDTHDTADSELAALGGYVSAKCLWRPNYDGNVAISEFLEAYYGAAAGPIRRYLTLIQDRVDRKNIHVGCGADTNSPHLTNQLLNAANRLWQEAETASAGDAARLQRVRVSRLSVDYAILERARSQMNDRALPDLEFRKLAISRFKPFFDTLKMSRLTRLHESQVLDKETYRKQVARDLRLAI
ncbi:MAG: DUF4838 domain-containing protein [Thermoguttaceae bacterium]